jgi:hypothetical protein
MRMRKYLVLGLAVAVALSVTGVAYGKLVQRSKVTHVRHFLPKYKRQNIKLSVRLWAYDTAAPVPAPARLAKVHLDDSILVRPRVARICRQAKLADQPTTTQARNRCRRAIVGKGVARVLVPNPEDPNLPAAYTGVVTAFNTTRSKGRPRVLIYTYIKLLGYGQPLVGTLVNSGFRRGDFGKMLRVPIPKLQLDAVLQNFLLNLGNGSKRGYIKANCRDRNKRTNVRAQFLYYGHGPRTANASYRCRR